MNRLIIVLFEKTYSEFFEMDVESICGDDCPLECDDVSYNLYSSHAVYPSRAYSKSLMKNPWIQAKYAYRADDSPLTYESLKDNMMQISVFYNKLGYENYEEVENMSLLDLISNFGGTLGLFLGMSFLSIVEILDFLLQICFHKRHRSTVIDVKPQFDNN